MLVALDSQSLDLLFRTARTHTVWKPIALDDAFLTALYDLARMGPTAANCQPLRVVFVKSPAAKEKLKPCLAPGNVDKTMSAPVTAVVGYDTEFFEKLPRLYPHADMRGMFASNAALAESTAFRSSSLQAAYLIMAARALGLDCGPMSGFDAAKVDAAFFPDGKIKTNMLINIGYGDQASLHPRGPRLGFAETCSIA